MILKYTVADTIDMMIGIRFKPDPDPKTNWGDLDVVGFGRHLGAMRDIVQGVIGVEAPEPHWVQANKCVLRVRARSTVLDRCIRQLGEAGMIVEQVTTLGRLVR
jgi:hypothetical protein